MPTLAIEKRDHLAFVTLEGTTMPPAFFDECGDTFRALADDGELRAVVIRAAGKAFSYGLDLPAAMAAFGPMLSGGAGGPGAAERHGLYKLIRRWQGCFEAVARLPVPVIAAIHGRCIGGGLDLASACDLRLATRDATFSLRETKVAIVADLGSLQRLPRIVGPAMTRELAFTGADITAERALAIGLVNRVLPDREALEDAAASLAREIADNPPLVVRGVKQVLDASAERTVDQGLDYVANYNAALLPSHDLVEAVMAFAERRPPKFSGR